MLSTKKYAPVISWITGWLTLVGNWTVTLSINFSGAQLVLSAITLWNEDFVATQWQTVLMFWSVMSVAFTVNVFGAKYLELINKICIYWTATSVIIIIVTVLVMSDDRRDAKFVFAHFDASASGWPSGWAWFVGLLQAACESSHTPLFPKVKVLTREGTFDRLLPCARKCRCLKEKSLAPWYFQVQQHESLGSFT
jgi:hypothetical protein